MNEHMLLLLLQIAKMYLYFHNVYKLKYIIISVTFNKYVIFPNSTHLNFIFLMKHSMSVHHIISEVANIFFSISEFKSTKSMFKIKTKITFICIPIIIEFREIMIVKLLFQFDCRNIFEVP